MSKDNEAVLLKNRKRGSKEFDDFDDTTFNNSHKSTRKIQTSAKEHRCGKNTQSYFCDFCDNTSIHGFKFLGERRRYLVEKLWWFIVVIGAFSGSSILIYKTYDKWIKGPVVVTFAMTETPIWKIPFPAVTICPELKINRSVVNYTDVYQRYNNDENVTLEEMKYLELFQLVCEGLTDDLYENKTITNDEFVKLYKAFHKLEADSCKWLGKDYDCETLMTPMLTSEGLCTTFNVLNPKDVYYIPEERMTEEALENTHAKKWSLETGYPEDVGLDTFPRRTILSGSKAGFEIVFDVDGEELDYLCTDLQGFKVTLHHPAEEPDMDKHFRVPLNQVVSVGIRPRMITTSEEIKSYNPQQRKCYLPGEKVLNIYRIYTQQNCMMECFTNYTLKLCGCISFYTISNDDTKYCGPASKECVEMARVQFFSHDAMSTTNKTNNFKTQNTPNCDCLPSCTSLEFDSETSQTDWQWRKSILTLLNNPENDWKSIVDTQYYSKLIVYYKEMQFMTSERHELFGTVDFLATCGGLLGLFCGFSFTSSMEILYYLTLRLFCNFKKFGRRVWSGDSELVEEEDRNNHSETVL